MHPSLSMLDRAIERANEEFTLLALDGVEGLEESAAARLDLVQQAWQGKDSCDPDALRERLWVLRDIQVRLDAAARKRFEETREDMKARKQASRAISGYGRKLSRSLQPLMITKTS